MDAADDTPARQCAAFESVRAFMIMMLFDERVATTFSRRADGSTRL
jgi:hypothetical protein